ncbi:MAG: NrfD/PsrC family molybdoenzyme membrane anchor subunit, partial [Acidimicrobiia bacterium]
MKRAFIVVTGIALLTGAFGLIVRLTTGHAATSYGSYVPWGLWVSMYIYFIGLSAGAFLLSTLAYVFRVSWMEKIGPLALFAALVSLIAALFSIWFDIGHMGRFYKIFLSPNFKSMMTWMVWLYTAYFILLVVEFALVIRPDWVRWRGMELAADVIARDRRVVRILGAVGVPLAVAFHGGVGALFGVVGARPFWNTGLYPIMFLISALASGGALLLFVLAFFWPATDPDRGSIAWRLSRLVFGLLLFDALMLFADYSVGLYGAIPAHAQAIGLVLFGPHAWAFWLVQVLIGLVIPVIIMVHPRISRQTAWLGVAGALAAFGFTAVRLNIVIP